MPLRAKLRQDGVASCSLVPLRTGEPRPPIVLTDPSIVIGAGSAAQIRLKSSSVSKAHAIILVEDGKAYVRDLASRTHLFVNDAPVREAFLREGDVVRVGRFGFGVHENAAAQARPHDPMAPTLRLRMGGTGAERVLAGRVILIGRRHGCDVIVPDHTLSGAHAVLFYLRGQWWVRDLGSRAGTLVNAAEVRQQRALSPGDRLTLGAEKIVFLGAAVAGETDAGELDEADRAGAAAVVPAARAAVSEPREAVNKPEAAMPGAWASPEDSGNPPQITERAAAMEAAQAPLTPAPAEEPVVPPVPVERELKRPAVFADAPIGRPVEELPPPPPAPLPPPPVVELPAQAEASPAAEPDDKAREARVVSAGKPGEELAAPVYRNGNSVDEEEGDSVDEDGDVPPDDGSSGGLETQPATEEEWDEAVTVWSFAELAQRGRERSSRDELQMKPGGASSSAAAGERRRWIWVTVGAAIACVAVLVTLLAHKLL